MVASPAETRAPAAVPGLDLPALPYRMDEGVAARAAIGLLVLATDQTMEYEFRQVMTIPGAAVYATRVYNDAEITLETLRAMRPLIAPATALILPDLRLDVIAFGCTSASIALGEETIFAEIRKARPAIACTTPVTAALAAFRAFGARRIGVLTPYSAEVNANVARYLEGRGVEVASFRSFCNPDDRQVARIAVASIAAGIREVARGRALDAVFVSCTSLRLCEAVAEIEAEVGLPVTSSDHALAWHSLRLAGIADPLPGLGRLFRLPL